MAVKAICDHVEDLKPIGKMSLTDQGSRRPR
jgi:hypothetical protein